MLKISQTSQNALNGFGVMRQK